VEVVLRCILPGPIPFKKKKTCSQSAQYNEITYSVLLL